MRRGEESVLSCVQLRDRLREEVEESWRMAGLVTTVVKELACQVAVP